MAVANTSNSWLSTMPTAGKIVFGVVFVLLVFVAYWTIFYVDVQARLSRLSNQQANLQQSLDAAKREEAAYHRDLAEFHERQQRQQTLNKALPDSASYPAFLSALQGAANAAGVTLIGWSPGVEVFEPYYAKVPLRVTVTGRFHHIAKFFDGVSRLDRIINIEDILLTEPKQINEELVVRADCTAVAFRTYLPHEGAARKKQKGAR